MLTYERRVYPQLAQHMCSRDHIAISVIHGVRGYVDRILCTIFALEVVHVELVLNTSISAPTVCCVHLARIVFRLLIQVTLRWLSEGHCRGGRLFFGGSLPLPVNPLPRMSFVRFDRNRKGAPPKSHIALLVIAGQSTSQYTC